MARLTRPPVIGSGVLDHGSLTGIADDDHPQYFTDARHDDDTEHVSFARICVENAGQTGYELYPQGSGNAIPSNTAGVLRHFIGIVEPSSITTLNTFDIWDNTGA